MMLAAGTGVKSGRAPAAVRTQPSTSDDLAAHDVVDTESIERHGVCHTTANPENTPWHLVRDGPKITARRIKDISFARAAPRLARRSNVAALGIEDADIPSLDASTAI